MSDAIAVLSDENSGLNSKGNWVQTERSAHESWALLIAKAPKAAALMHVFTARVGEHNAVIISHKNLARLLNVKSLTTVKTAITVLVENNWIEVRQLGKNGSANAYVVNDRVAWSGKRDGIRYSLFSAAVVVSSDEQRDEQTLSQKAALRSIPISKREEQQLPTGEGLPPPSEPALPGLELPLPMINGYDS